MAQIYQLGSRSVYDDMGRTIDAKTGQPVQQTPASPITGQRTLDTSGGTQQGLSFDRGQQPQGDVGGQFGLLLMDLLKQHQQLGTRPFAEQGFNAREEQIRRLRETPSSLIGASPDIQASVRGAAGAALQPTIAGAREGMQTFGEQIKGLGSSIAQAQAIGEWMQKAEQENQTSARDLIFKIPSAVKRLPDKEKRALEQRAGLQKGLIDLLPETEEKVNTQVIELPDGKKALIDTQTGNIIKEYGGGITPSVGGVQKYKFGTIEDINALPVSEITKSIIAGYGTTKDLTPTDKTLVRTELYRIGFNPYEYINKKLDSLANQYDLVPPRWRGLAQGRIPLASSISPEAAQFESQKTILTREVARLFDVGVLSDQDVASYKAAMPSRSDASRAVVNSKIAGVKTSLSAGLVTEDKKQGQFSTTAPNGKRYVFPSQEALEQFKRAAGIQ